MSFVSASVPGSIILPPPSRSSLAVFRTHLRVSFFVHHLALRRDEAFPDALLRDETLCLAHPRKDRRPLLPSNPHLLLLFRPFPHVRSSHSRCQGSTRSQISRRERVRLRGNPRGDSSSASRSRNGEMVSFSFHSSPSFSSSKP